MLTTQPNWDIQKRFAGDITTLRRLLSSQSDTALLSKEQINKSFSNALFSILDKECGRTTGIFLIEEYKVCTTEEQSVCGRNRDAISDIVVSALSDPRQEYRILFPYDQFPPGLGHDIASTLMKQFSNYRLTVSFCPGNLPSTTALVVKAHS